MIRKMKVALSVKMEGWRKEEGGRRRKDEKQRQVREGGTEEMEVENGKEKKERS